MRKVALIACLTALTTTALGSSPVQAAPLYDIKATWGDTNLPPGGEGQFTLQVRNIGDEAAEKKLFISDELPLGVEITDISWRTVTIATDLTSFCSGIGTETLSCVVPADEVPKQAPPPTLKKEGFLIPEPSGYMLPLHVEVAIDPGASGFGTNTASVSGGGALAGDTDVDQVPFGATPSAFGIVPGSFQADLFEDAYPSEATSRPAGDHPFEQRVIFDLTAESRASLSDGTRETPANGTLRTIEVTLPRGLIGNPESLPKCDPLKFAQPGVVNNATQCPPNTQVGYLNVLCLFGGTGNHGNGIGLVSNGCGELVSRVPIYNLDPPKGTPVDLAFNAGGFVITHIYAVLDPAQNYAIKALVPNISSLVNVKGSEATLWGVPADPAHDRFRYYTKEAEGFALGTPFEGTIRPFFTNPMDCDFDNGGHRIRVDSYQDPDNFTPVEEYGDPLNVEGCEDPRFRFEPEISLQPTSRAAGGPTGLDVHLEVPQRDLEVDEAKKLYAANGYVKGISTPPMKKAVVTFPEGMTLSPSAAQGLGNCSPEQIGLGTDDPVTCPDNSQYGTLTLHTPALPIDEQPEGWIYIAKQSDNPFHNFLSLYLVIQEPDNGILVKIPGRVDLDPVTGQITTTFDDLPQFPVSDMQMTWKGGVRAGLVNPSTCGKKTITAEFFSWHEPSKSVSVDSSYQITQRPDGSPCVNNLSERPFAPKLEAGTLNNVAGAYAPFVFRLTRTDDDQEFSQLGVTLPPGLSAKIAGVSECSETGIARAVSRTGAGEGALERADPSCPASSLIGATDVGLGVGVPLTYVPGRVYLAGPYRGAPLSMVVITPAVVGPYDLGVVAVRAALNIDPETAQASVFTNPFPLIYQGIPVRLRDIRVKVDRPDFTLNPTSCAEKQISAHITGTGGDLNSIADDTAADLSNRFQAADCASLTFKPKLFLRLFGATHRGAHPKFKAVVRMPAEGANMAQVSVALPRSEFLDQGHIRTVCTRVQFAAEQCPQGSVYGHVVAKSPLLDEALSGPVYLRSSSHKLPDLVLALRGKVDVNAVSRVDSVGGGIRNTFELIPDVPVSWVVLTMQGGEKGLLVNSTDLCAKVHRATAKFKAQNGRIRTLHPAMQASCAKKHSRRHRNAKR